MSRFFYRQISSSTLRCAPARPETVGLKGNRRVQAYAYPWKIIKCHGMPRLYPYTFFPFLKIFLTRTRSALIYEIPQYKR